MRFPDRLEVQLVAADKRASLASILVSIDTHVQGRYYFGALVGLSDATGAVTIERGKLERAFQRNRELFVMDYKVDLASCDSRIAVRVQGAREFQEAQSAATTNPFMSEEDRTIWVAAQNHALASSSLYVDLTEHPTDVVRLLVPVRQADPLALGRRTA